MFQMSAELLSLLTVADTTDKGRFCTVDLIGMNTQSCGPEQCSPFSDSLQAGRSGDRIPRGARFSTPVQPGPWSPPSLLYNVYQVFPWSKETEAWCWPPTPSSAEVKERVELYLCSTSEPSWPVLGWTLHVS